MHGPKRFEGEASLWVNTFFLVPEPGIQITREHIANAAII
jgi:hypothetical protein